MTDERDNLRARREIVLGYIEAIDRQHELFEVCAAASGDPVELQHAIEKTFNVSAIAAEAMMDMQVRNFTPTARARMLEDLSRIQALLGE